MKVTQLKVQPRPTIKAAAMCEKAAQVIYERAAQRDKPQGEKTMAATVKMFNVLAGTSLTEVQGWQFMQILKLVRSSQGVYVADDFIDGIGYAALAAEAADGNA